MARHRLAVLAAGLIVSACAQAQPGASLFDRLHQRVEQREADLVAIRHNIHRHPELSGEEERTAGIVARRLADLGFEVRTGVGGHGVVGVLRGGHPGPMVAFRADMDAVRDAALDPVEYRSVVPGVRHICGHDVHTAIGLGLAEGFAAIRDDLPGSILLLFQPAEERGIGANAMLADGAFEPVAPDAIFAVHTAPYDVGTVGTVAGGMMAGRARFSITIRGAHDMDRAVAAVRQSIESVGTLRRGESFSPGSVEAFFVEVVPQDRDPYTQEEARVRGEMMTAGYEDRDRARTAVLSALEALDLPGATIETAYDERAMEGVVNDAALVGLANDGIGALTPEVEIRTVQSISPFFSEDFGSFQAHAPGVMYFLGVSNPEAGTVGMPHTPNYVADDAAILVGVRTMAAAMLHRMTAPPSEPEVFAPGVISTEAIEYGATFTPDGRTVYFTRRASWREAPALYVSHLVGGTWQEPEILPFSGTHGDEYPSLSPDGSRLYFASKRPVDGGEALGQNDIWVVERTADGWGAPAHLPPPINSEVIDSHPFLSPDGDLYFHSNRDGAIDMYVAQDADGDRISRLDLNSPATDGEFVTTPDGQCAIFYSEREGSYGAGDLYATCRDGDEWGPPHNLGEVLNTPDYEWTPTVSPDGEHLVFARLADGQSDLYQIRLGELMDGRGLDALRNWR